MRYLAMSILLTLSTAPDRPNPTPAPPQNDQELIQTTWRVVVWQTENGQMDPETLKNYARLTFKDGKYHWSSGGGGTYAIDPNKSPKTVDYVIAGAAGQLYKGIYELNGDTLRDCMAPPGRERPTDFTTPPGSGHILMVYKRVK